MGKGSLYSFLNVKQIEYMNIGHLQRIVWVMVLKNLQQGSSFPQCPFKIPLSLKELKRLSKWLNHLINEMLHSLGEILVA